MVSTRGNGTLLLLLAAFVGLRMDRAAGAPMRGRETSRGCQRSSPELAECVGAAVQHFVNFMSSGKVSPWRSITPFDPLHLPNMTIFQERRVRAVYVNRYLVGLKNAFIQDVRIDMERLEFNMTALVPALEMLGMFSAERLQDHQASENSILTFSIRNIVVNFAAKGTLTDGSTSSREGTGRQQLRLQLGISSLSIASYVLSEHLSGSGSHVGPFDAAGRLRGGASAKFMKLIERDLRLQLTKRLQHVVNEALALAPFEQLFPA